MHEFAARIERYDQAKPIGHRDGKCNCDECRILAIGAERDELDTECAALRERVADLEDYLRAANSTGWTWPRKRDTPPKARG